jgi:nuclease S1
MKPFRCVLETIVLVVLAIFAPPQSFAWGCKGHYITALIAEKHLTPHARDMVAQILDAGPVDRKLSRYCKDLVSAFADASTWADDVRGIQPSTAGWHFIDIPRGVSSGDISRYCPASTGCVTKAIADQLALLRSPNVPASTRADALRYVIHFIGDIHQPLHATSNNDRGGNCVPVNFFGLAPKETDAQKESFRPNLHSIWDSDLLDRFSGDRTLQQLANDLDFQFKPELSVWQSDAFDPDSWAWEGHEVAERAAYGFLPSKIAIENRRKISSCADDDHVAIRNLNLKETLADEYQEAAAPVVQQQLVKAGIRLAAVLNSLWP